MAEGSGAGTPGFETWLHTCHVWVWTSYFTSLFPISSFINGVVVRLKWGNRFKLLAERQHDKLLSIRGRQDTGACGAGGTGEGQPRLCLWGWTGHWERSGLQAVSREGRGQLLPEMGTKEQEQEQRRAEERVGRGDTEVCFRSGR